MTLGVRKTQDPSHPAAQTRLQQVGSGLIAVGDGLVRVLSAGNLATKWQLAWAIRCAKRNWK